MCQTRPRNRLLAALPEAEWDLLRPCLTRVDLKPRQVLQHPHTPVEHAYFVERGAVTFQARTEAEGPVGVGLVDGGALIGLPVVLGTMRSYLRALVEVAGEAYRISAADLRTVMDQSPVLHDLLLAYVQSVLVQSAQLVLCTSQHRIEQRLARWLLLAHDLLDEDLCVTHQMLSRDLGVRRATISETLHGFQQAGLIRQRRACLEVADRAGLEGVACECYGLISRAYRQSLRRASALSNPSPEPPRRGIVQPNGALPD